MKPGTSVLHKWGNRLLPERFSRKRYFAYYTMIFAVMVLAVFGVFFVNGKSFIWQSDGWKQHYRAMVYYAQWLRSIVRTLLTEHRLEIPAFSFSIGYGSDILTTLHYYVIGDPLTVFCVFVPTKYIAGFYNALVLVRLYLSGVTFSLFCFYKEDQVRNAGQSELFSKASVLAGAFAYVFCGYALIASVRHPYFINPMIYFPLILIGVEKILDGKKPWLFIVMVFISAISNFYFFYMIAILTALYVLWRLIVLYHWEERVAALKKLGKITASALLGTCMSAVVLLPVIVLFLGDTRSESGYVYDSLYDIGTYESNLGGFLSASSYHDWLVMGYAAVALITVFLLFLQKSHRDVKVAFIVLSVMTLIPAAGSIMNGFSYVSNRWVWGYSFLVAYILVLKWRALFELSAKDKWRLALCLGIYFLLCILLVKARTIAVCFALAMLFFSLMLIPAVTERFGVRWAQLALTFCVLASICGNALFLFSPRAKNYVSYFIDSTETLSGLQKSEAAAVETVSADTDEFFRYSGTSTTWNGSLYSGLSNTQYYWSLSASSIATFRQEFAFTDNTTTYLYKTLDSRAFLSTLANVKYYVQDGYTCLGKYDVNGEEVDTADTVYTLWENDYFLPFGYTYDGYISREDYEAMTPLEKQEAMMQGCVIDSDDPEGAEAEVALTGSSVEYQIEEPSEDSGITVDGNCITVTKSNATLTLTFDGVENAETYLYLTGLSYSGFSPRELYTDEVWEALSVYEQNNVLYSEKYWVEPTSLTITVKGTDTESAAVSSTLTYSTPKYTWYGDIDEFMVNLGYDENARVYIILTFPTTGVYTFDSLDVLCQPMDNYADQVAALAEDTLENVDFHENSVEATNEVTGTISLDSDKYLLLTIPYTSGWTAYVDGEEQELLQANTMYMALYLEAGDHEIQLVYHTPGKQIGLIVSAVSTAILLAAVGGSLYQKKRAKKALHEKEV
ncbi:MAG: YfhO family protein [Clostridiales bacterium]|nr:YfhO family protein [Clostridiales bacterium]